MLDDALSNYFQAAIRTVLAAAGTESMARTDLSLITSTAVGES
jgi:hypothetical protein